MSSADDKTSSSAAPIPAELIQGSPEWHAKRCGKITASCFGRLSGTGRSGDWTQTAITYMTEVMAERITGVPQDEIKSKYLDHGNKYEPTARQLYQWHFSGNRQELKQVGFVDHPTLAYCGGSPDSLVGDDGSVEIKCPYTVHTHLANIEMDATKNKDYTWQMQGNLWITGRKWCDFVSFHPFLPTELQFHVVRYERDEDVIDEIESRVTRALEQIAVRIKNIEQRVRLSVGDES